MKEKKNYLDYVPLHHSGISYQKKEDGCIEVEVINKGFYNRVAQLFFHRPKKSYIKLDEFGSFVWNQVDGKRTIYDICILLKERFGERTEPLFERAVSFFKVLRRASLICYQKGEISKLEK